jgi:hypothetical protein
VRPLLLLVLLHAAPARAEVVDRVLYVVEDQVVLLSDVQIDQAIGPLDASPSPFWTRPGVAPEQRVVDAAIIRELAGDVSLYQPSDAAVRERLEAIRLQFPDAAAWSTFLAGRGLEEESLAALLRRRMVSERYLARTLRADPADTRAFQAACDALLEEARPRVRIRYVEPTSPEPTTP